MVNPTILKGNNSSQIKGKAISMSSASGQHSMNRKHHNTKARKVLILQKLFFDNDKLTRRAPVLLNTHLVKNATSCLNLIQKLNTFLCGSVQKQEAVSKIEAASVNWSCNISWEIKVFYALYLPYISHQLMMVSARTMHMTMRNFFACGCTHFHDFNFKV